MAIATKIKFGDYLNVTDEGGGIIRVDGCPPAATKGVIATTAPGALPAINTDAYNVAHFTGLATAITSMTTNLSGTPADGDELRISFTDNGTARAITWGGGFEASTVSLPTTTVANARLDVLFYWNTETSKWRCVVKA